jgi:hypothetical protein
MDDYYLSKEEWDMLLEMGMAHLSDKQLLSKVASDVKSHLTRTYDLIRIDVLDTIRAHMLFLSCPLQL